MNSAESLVLVKVVQLVVTKAVMKALLMVVKLAAAMLAKRMHMQVVREPWKANKFSNLIYKMSWQREV